jgi:predicted dehydrogenase
MSQRRLHIAIVGAGLMGRWHAHYVKRAGGIVTAVVDAREEPAKALAGRHAGAKVFTSLEAALGAQEIDAVHVCTGLDSHVALAEAAIAAGKHVLVEKPVAPMFEETRKLLELAAEHHVLLVPVHQFPFQRGMQRLIRGRDRLGEIVRIVYRTCSGGGEGQSEARRRDILLEILPHPLSLFNAVLSDGLSGVEWRVQTYSADDLVMAGMVDGADLAIAISLRGRPTCNELTITGTQATARADLFHGFAVMDRGALSRRSKMLRPFRVSSGLLAAAGMNLAGRTVRREIAYPGLAELISGFYDSIRYNSLSPILPEEVLLAAGLLDRVRNEGEMRNAEG